MILAVFGTTGELIKLAPVLLRLRARDAHVVLATTGQQVNQIPYFLEQFGLPEPHLWLARGAGTRDLATTRDIPPWLAKVAVNFARERRSLRRRLRSGQGSPLVLVHGDTMTTVLGSLMGRALRFPVAHIESGLRSGDLRHPFPEELNRRITSRLARVHYAPGAWAAANLRRANVVDTGCNTIRDSIDLVPQDLVSAVPAPAAPFGLVSLHRFELLNDRDLLTRTLTTLAAAARTTPMLFVDHSVTAAAVSRFGLDSLFDDVSFRRVPRARFFDFLQLERRCLFVVTDSGGSQEECYYLDRPCLVHRKRTERQDGLGETTVLSGLEIGVLEDFLRDPGRHRRQERARTSVTVRCDRRRSRAARLPLVAFGAYPGRPCSGALKAPAIRPNAPFRRLSG